METIRYELDAEGIATLTFDEPGAPGAIRLPFTD